MRDVRRETSPVYISFVYLPSNLQISDTCDAHDPEYERVQDNATSREKKDKES